MNAQRRALAAGLFVAAILAMALALLRPNALLASSMNFARVGHAAITLNDGSVLVFGGTAATAAELYSTATDSWSLTGAMEASRNSPAAVRLADGRVLAIGGTALVPWGEIYDPATRRWSRTAAMSAPRQAPGAALLPDGRVLVAGGQEGLASNEIYNPAANTWTPAAPNLAGPRPNQPQVTTLADGRVFVVGGTSASSNSAEIYDPQTDSWQLIPPVLPPGRPTLVQLADGHLLIVSAEGEQFAARFDPATNALAPVAPPARLVAGQSLTLLADGRVLQVGLRVLGIYPGPPTGSARIYDPAADRWFAARPPESPRFFHSATLLADERVLLAGGLPETGSGVVNDAELYNPAGAAYANERFMPLLRISWPMPPPPPPGTITPTPWLTPGPPVTPPPGGPTPTPRTAEVPIVDVVLADPGFPNAEEYVVMTNRGGGPIALTGWRLVNASRPEIPPFVFPSFTIRPDTVTVVWSESGTNDLEAGDFFWNQTGPVWRAGDRAELRDAQGNLVTTFEVR